MDFIDLKSQQHKIHQEIVDSITAVLAHGGYILGPEVGELESKLSAYTGTRHCISCANGTDALLMPLMALGVGPGDAIFVPTMTFIATAEVVALLGATPVFVDIEDVTYNIDPQNLRDVIARIKKEGKLKPRGIIPVDLFGHPAPYNEILALAQENNLFVLEDAAQSFGATYHGKRAGSLAPIASTSFFPAKPLGCYGDGGAIFTDSDELAETLRSIRVHGQGRTKYENVRVGINGRLDTIQAAVLLQKMRIFDEEIELRQRVARKYNEALGSQFVVPRVHPHCLSVWAQYGLRSDHREEILLRLAAEKIPYSIYYPIPLHLQKAFSHLGYNAGSLPVAEKVAKTIFSIPMHPYLTEQDQDRIIKALLGR